MQRTVTKKVDFTIKYASVGIINTIAAYIIYLILSDIFQPENSYIVAALLITTLNIFLHDKITTQNSKIKRKKKIILILYVLSNTAAYYTIKVSVNYSLDLTLSYILSVVVYQAIYSSGLYSLYIRNTK